MVLRRTQKRHILAGLLVAGLALGTLPAVAQGGPAGGDFKVNLSNGARIRTPDVAYRGDGGFVTVWREELRGLEARFFTPQGGPVGGDLSLAVDDPIPSLPFHGELTLHKEPAVLSRPGGGMLVAWTEERVRASIDIFFDSRVVLQRTIVARTFDRDGQPTGPVVPLSEPGDALASLPRLAALSDGRVLVVWQSASADPETNGVFARLLDRDGNTSGAAFRIDAAGDAGRRPAVAADLGGFVVAWEGCCDDGGDNGIFARLIDPGDLASGVRFQVNTGTFGDEGNAAVAVGPAGEAVVVWQSPIEGAPREFRLYGQVVGADGTLLGGEFNLDGKLGRASSAPILASVPGGRVLAAWITWLGDFRVGVNAAWIDRLPGTGDVQVSTPFAVSSDPIGAQFEISAAANPAGEFLVAWEGFRSRRLSVTARRVESGTGPVNQAAELPVCPPGSSAFDPSCAH